MLDLIMVEGPAGRVGGSGLSSGFSGQRPSQLYNRAGTDSRRWITYVIVPEKKLQPSSAGSILSPRRNSSARWI